jgi:hypothetical protein
MTKLIVVIGAGFSRAADFPTGNDLNQKFFESMENKILNMSSDEWVWDEYDDATSNNGRLNSDYLNISYLLSEFVECYQREFCRIFNYEEFYDWFRDKYNNQELLEELALKVNERLKKDFKIDDSSEHIIKEPNINHYNKIYKSFNYLIGDLLLRPYKRVEKKDYYKVFIDYLNHFEEIEIYSLNHDLLIEFLLSEFNINYSDGFTTNNSPIRGDNNEILKIFDNYYPNKIRLYKLHGSIDYHLFEEMIEEGAISRPTGKYWYYKPGTYHNKHFAKRIDLSTNEVVQKYNFNTLPQFLTGKNKMDFIQGQHFYGDLYDNFVKTFINCTELLTIGYSFADLHINSVIKSSIDKYNFKIVNVNPGQKFPYRKDYTTKSFVNIDKLEDLKMPSC